METWIERQGRVEIEGTVFVIAGSSGASWSVARLPDGTWVCSCPDFTYRAPGVPGYECKHIPRAKIKLAEEVRLVGDLL